MVEILSIEALLNKKLAIPNYQRPYKWTNKNMSDLLEDIILYDSPISNIALEL